MNTQDRMLVEVLAWTDAAWAPLRRVDWQSPPAGQNAYHAQLAFATAGVPWASGAATELGRKQAQRLLAGLASNGLMISLFATKARTVGVRLTDAGEHRARALAALPTMVDAHTQLRALVKFGPDLWVNECCLWTGRRNSNYPREITSEILWEIQATFYPALSRQLVIAGSDCDGRAYYFARPAGIRWAKAPSPKLPGDLPEPDEEAVDACLAAWRARRDELRTRTPENRREVGLCPLPAGCPMVRAADGHSEPPPRAKPRKSTASSER